VHSSWSVCTSEPIPKFQFELLDKYGNDEQQTALKWDKRSYPFAKRQPFPTIFAGYNTGGIEEYELNYLFAVICCNV